MRWGPKPLTARKAGQLDDITQSRFRGWLRRGICADVLDCSDRIAVVACALCRRSASCSYCRHSVYAPSRLGCRRHGQCRRDADFLAACRTGLRTCDRRSILGLGLAVNLARDIHGKTEWYPVGRILAWIVAISIILTLAGSLALAPDYAGFVSAFDEFAEAIESIDPMLFAGLDAAARVNAISALSRLMAMIAAPISAAISVASFVLLIYLAARVAKASSRLPRPWPDLARVAMPRATVIILGLSIAGSVVLSDYPALLSRITLASLAMGFCLQGLAFVHLISRPLKSRRAVLAMLYFTFSHCPVGRFSASLWWALQMPGSR